MTAILIQFKPPKVQLRLRNASIRGEELGYFNTGQIFFGYEFISFKRGSSFNKTRVTVADDYPDQLSAQQLSGLADLVSGRWRDVYKYHRKEKAWTGINPPEPPIPRQFTLSKDFVSDLELGIDLLSASKRFRISIERWHTGVRRNDSLDAVLDLCSSLEACFAPKEELRLRLSFAVRSVLDRNKKNAALTVHKMYGVRSDFIHGSKVPTVTAEDDYALVRVVSKVLLTIIRNKSLPSPDKLTEKIFSTRIVDA